MGKTITQRECEREMRSVGGRMSRYGGREERQRLLVGGETERVGEAETVK